MHYGRLLVLGLGITLGGASLALAQSAGWPWPLVWLRLAVAARQIRQVRFTLLGVLPEASGAGVAALLAHEAGAAARRRGLAGGELSLIHADNHRVRHVIEAFGGHRCKTYRLFEKAIGLDPEYAPAHYQMGLALKRKGKQAEAQQAFSRAKQLDPRLRMP